MSGGVCQLTIVVAERHVTQLIELAIAYRDTAR